MRGPPDRNEPHDKETHMADPNNDSNSEVRTWTLMDNPDRPRPLTSEELFEHLARTGPGGTGDDPDF
ncbi:hypothetical protein DDK00_05340 [Mycobacteroides abscessus]|nr:hypothetical protein DDJ94_05345 [Mycobacteroides abscessus]PVA80628.1 hypothetical protein DDK00_05340 [Mycobacteroides abscessus]RIR25265.1 hypothetical protein D2E41_05745 [Mycobacteroides abscessus]RIT94991.1 hypothetical protein D2E84_16955 [Mycobacteroides abscessus]